MIWALLPALSAGQDAPAVDVAAAVGVVVDGALDEPAWGAAAPITDFRRYLPAVGGAPAGTTEVRFLQDERTLYVGVRVRGAGYPIRARVSAREEINSDDQVGIYLDPFGNAQSGYIFYLNALGIQQDIRWQGGRWNVNWDTVMTSCGRVVDDGFDLEVAIPFRSLKYPSGSGAQRWGAIVTRKIPSEGMKYAWPALTPGHPRLFAQAGALVGVRPPAQGSGVELVPGFSARFEASRTPDGGWTDSTRNPWYDQVRPMLDVRAGLTPNVGLTLTANPDFSEVESDTTPVRVNQRFAFQFQERRRFFTDGIEMFQDSLDTLYTRAIVEPLWGVKVAGREGAWTVGALHAVDRSAAPSVNEVDAWRSRAGAPTPSGPAPWASDAVVRVRRDLPRSGHVGLTLVDRRLFGAGFTPGSEHAHDAAALDISALFGDRWSLTAANMQSITGEPGAQRWGQRTLVELTRAPGQGTGVELRVDDRTREFRQELGYLPQSGLTSANLLIDHTIVPRSGGFTTITPFAGGSFVGQRNGENYRSIRAGADAVYGGIHAFTVQMQVDARRETRIDADWSPEASVADGAPYADVGGWELWGSYGGQIGAAVEVSPWFSVGRTTDFSALRPARTWSTGLTTSLRPLTNLRIDLTGRYVSFTPVGDETQQDALGRMRAWWQLTRTVGFRAVEEVSAAPGGARLRHSVLAVWQLHPFTAAYLGYDESASLAPYAVQNRSVFAKVYVWWRP